MLAQHEFALAESAQQRDTAGVGDLGEALDHASRLGEAVFRERRKRGREFVRAGRSEKRRDREDEGEKTRR